LNMLELKGEKITNIRAKFQDIQATPKLDWSKRILLTKILLAISEVSKTLQELATNPSTYGSSLDLKSSLRESSPLRVTDSPVGERLMSGPEEPNNVFIEVDLKGTIFFVTPRIQNIFGSAIFHFIPQTYEQLTYAHVYITYQLQ